MPSWMWWWISRFYFVVVRLISSIYARITTRRCVEENTDELLNISATQVVDLIRRRRLTVSSLITAYIRRIKKINNQINALVIDTFDEAIEQAKELDDHIFTLSDEELDQLITDKPLLGIPFTIKDCISVDGVAITCGMYMRKDNICNEDAQVVKKLRQAGGILLGITNVSEMCMWIEAYNKIYGRTNNPYDLRRISGGSSGGEAALIASSGGLIGFGTDTGGSIRLPTFFNGIFGVVPTPGVISLEGVIPEVTGYRTQMTRIGPLCRYAEDIPLIYKAIGKTESLQLDKNIVKIKVFYMEEINDNTAVENISDELRVALRKAVKYLESTYNTTSTRLDLTLMSDSNDYFLHAMHSPGDLKIGQIALCFDGTKGSIDFKAEFWKWIKNESNFTFLILLTGLMDIGEMFDNDRKAELDSKRLEIDNQLRDLLGNDGVFLFPSYPRTAPLHNEPIFSPMGHSYMTLFSALAYPVIQCPLGLDSNGIPLGCQIVGPPNSDNLLINVARHLESGFGGWTPPRRLK